MARAVVGTGKEVVFGKMSAAKLIKTDDSNGVRDRVVKRVTATACGTPDYGPGLAGGDRARFEELKNAPAGKEPSVGPDLDYTIVRTHKRRLPK